MYRVSEQEKDFLEKASTTFPTVAFPTGFCPTTTQGATSQRPTHGAGSTRTSRPRTPGSFSSRASAPAMAHEMESQTRTVSGAGERSPSFTTSK